MDDLSPQVDSSYFKKKLLNQAKVLFTQTCTRTNKNNRLCSRMLESQSPLNKLIAQRNLSTELLKKLKREDQWEQLTQFIKKKSVSAHKVFKQIPDYFIQSSPAFRFQREELIKAVKGDFSYKILNKVAATTKRCNLLRQFSSVPLSKQSKQIKDSVPLEEIKKKMRQEMMIKQSKISMRGKIMQDRALQNRIKFQRERAKTRLERKQEILKKRRHQENMEIGQLTKQLGKVCLIKLFKRRASLSGAVSSYND